MPIHVSLTPNPNAMKFSCGVPVGGPSTYVVGSEPPEDFARDLLGIPGVISIFMTADFITVSKAPGEDWTEISAAATTILEKAFGG